MINEFNAKTFKLKNINIFGVEYGEGPLIIMVHGWPESWYSWRHQIKPLAKLGYKVVAIDVRGYGQSSKPQEVEKYDMLSLVGDLLDIINEENEEQAILIGHDWGAPICWTTVALHPEKVRAVVGLSVPHSRRGNISNSELWRQIYKDNFFYQTYFEKEGVAEEELERDVGASLRKIYYWISAEGHDAKVRTNFDKDSELLDGLVDPEPFPNWLTEEDLNFYIKEFKNSGFRGPINRYRNQDRDWENIPELF